MFKNKSFIKSLKTAFFGILKPFRTEINLRFHFMIGNLIILFAHFYGISKIEWAVLILTIALVFCAELVNTALENAVDTATNEYKKTAEAAKDAAAGAVLFAAVCAVVVGFFLFFDLDRLSEVLTYIFTTPKVLIPSLILGIADILFVVFGGKQNYRTN
ncbi:MAG: diacylglycerol kinase family protein [Clostridia bacterium]|nr:diacylglycerol kinase family protein [Clostridia bacterium]